MKSNVYLEIIKAIKDALVADRPNVQIISQQVMGNVVFSK